MATEVVHRRRALRLDVQAPDPAGAVHERSVSDLSLPPTGASSEVFVPPPEDGYRAAPYRPPPRKSREWLDKLRSFVVIAGTICITVLMFLIYVELKPVLSNARVFTGMLADKTPAMSESIDHATTLVNNTSVDMLIQYNSVMDKATTAVGRVEDLINDPQAQENIRAFTYALTKGNLQRVGTVANYLLDALAAMSQSAGDNGVSISFGRWRAYMNTTSPE